MNFKFYFRILQFGRGYRKNVALGLGLLALYNLFSAVSLAMIIPFLDILFSDKAPNLPTTTLAWYNISGYKQLLYYRLHEFINTNGKVQTLAYFCGFVAIAVLLKNLFRYLSSYTITPLEFGVIRNLRKALFDRLSALSLAFYTRKRRGYLVNVVVTDMQNVQDTVVGTLVSIASDPLTMLFFFIGMLIISWKLTLFMLLVLPATAYVISRISQSLKKRMERGQSTFDDLLSLVDEFIGGIRIVKGFGAEGYVRGKYDYLNNRFSRIMTSFRRQVDLASPITEVLSVLVILAIIMYGGSLILSERSELKASEFIGFIALFSQFITPIKTLSQAIARIQKAKVSFARIEQLLEEPLLPTESIGGAEVHSFEEEIRLEHVSFQYDSERTILEDISLTIHKGETFALVGPSGGGKSTLIDLICRFYDPQEGSIYLDGVDMRSLNGTSMRKLMGIVSQEGILFNDTIRNNIAYAEPQRSLEEIIHAAQIANAHEFIQQLPLGYDTMIGERGIALSGGQRQRISIARAVLKNPPILILDEATSALDSESERLVQDALNKLLHNRTCIVIAHRLSTIVRADRIAVIREGHLEEQGTHEELLLRGGVYSKLYHLQFQDQPTVT